MRFQKRDQKAGRALVKHESSSPNRGRYTGWVENYHKSSGPCIQIMIRKPRIGHFETMHTVRLRFFRFPVISFIGKVVLDEEFGLPKIFSWVPVWFSFGYRTNSDLPYWCWSEEGFLIWKSDFLFSCSKKLLLLKDKKGKSQETKEQDGSVQLQIFWAMIEDHSRHKFPRWIAK